MIDSLYLAWRYLGFHRGRSLILVACVTLIAVLPLSLERLLHESERQLLDRATSTPLLVGAKGSALDLAMNALYFSEELPGPLSMAAVATISESGLALPVPLYVRFQALGFPIVGTGLDYFDFRGLAIAEGRPLVLLGECVLGATVARQLGLEPGDSLMSSSETVFDIAGVYPLKMQVVGVLKPAGTPDDLAVFVDTRTAWVIEGLVHGHEDVTRTSDEKVIMERSESNVTANARLMQYNEITASNIDSFHFHGDAAQYPLTAVIAVPGDARSGTLLRGRYLDEDSRQQIIQPKQVIEQLLDNIFRIKQVLDAIISMVGVATLLALILVFTLSLRLREREINTNFQLGCSRATIAQLLLAEIFIIVLASGVLCAGIILAVDHYSGPLVRHLFIT